ncbi:MAG: hypothetical protein ACPGXI_15780 [Mycobacterium sp.]
MWWFYTVILGIAFGQLISQLTVTVRDWCWEPQRRPFVPAMLWQIFLLVLVIEVWLASTYYRETLTHTTILELVAYLIVPAGILVMSVLLPPSNPAVENDGTLSRSVAFARVRPIFFGVLIFFIAVNLLHDTLIGEQSWDLDLLFQGLIVAGGVVGLFLRKTAADIALAVLMIGFVITYIGMGYASVVVDDMV